MPNLPLIKCSLCHMDIFEGDYIKHYARVHKFDPNFVIQCNQIGCGATYRKWASFRVHIKRVHKIDVDIQGEPNSIDDFQEDDVTSNSDENESEIPPELSPEELVCWNGAMFIMNLKETCGMPQTTVKKVIDGASDLIKEILNCLEKMLRKKLHQNAGFISESDVNSVLTNLKDINIFSDVESISKMNNFLGKCGMVKAQRKVLGKSRVWKKGGKLCTKEDVAYVVPFLPNLQLFLNNPDVLSCVENPKPYDGTLRSVTDGDYYRTHEVVQRDKKALSIIVYFDDVEYANPLGSKKCKLSMFYWTLGNIYPELRSSLRVINLLAITTQNNLKRHGAQEVLDDLITSLKALGSKEGVMLEIEGRSRAFYGMLNFIAGDTPASAFLGGFKEGVGQAKKPCRRCRADVNQLKEYYVEEDFVLRNMTTHMDNVKDVTMPGLSKQAWSFWSSFHGVNGQSPFMFLENADVTQLFPHDIMHVIFEGVLATNIKVFLNFCIDHNLFTLESFNDALSSFDYCHLSKDKPSPLDASHLLNGIKQGAAQMLCLGAFLPFIIGNWLHANNDSRIQQRLSNFILFLQITNLTMSFEFETQDAHLMKRMVSSYLRSFTKLYPEQKITPKMHYLVHMGSQVLNFGPLRQQSCFRFEGAHAYYKQLICKLKNFINVPFTLSYRKQALMAVQLTSIPGGSSRKFLYVGDDVKVGKRLCLQDHQHCNSLKELLNVGTDTVVMISPEVRVYGTVYRRKVIILLQETEYMLPKFGEVSEIIIYSNQKILVYSELQTVIYEEALNAYLVTACLPAKTNVIDISELMFPHTLSSFRYCQKSYVILFGSRRTEFEG